MFIYIYFFDKTNEKLYSHLYICMCIRCRILSLSLLSNANLNYLYTIYTIYKYLINIS